jgi:hypothetical protein
MATLRTPPQGLFPFESHVSIYSCPGYKADPACQHYCDGSLSIKTSISKPSKIPDRTVRHDCVVENSPSKIGSVCDGIAEICDARYTHYNLGELLQERRD